ncbi:hypothetical protein NKG94_08600 [Micromonospora sp. M12]
MLVVRARAAGVLRAGVDVDDVRPACWPSRRYGGYRRRRVPG